jgi:DNA-binding transcriptional regulator GbsR (MarR family)
MQFRQMIEVREGDLNPGVYRGEHFEHESFLVGEPCYFEFIELFNLFSIDWTDRTCYINFDLEILEVLMVNEAEREFIEKVGLTFEQLGLPRMGGRIIGWLLISESPQATMGELAEALQASKSSISSVTRLLIQVNLIEIVSVPGIRRDYFRIRDDAWTNALKDRFTQAAIFRQLAEEGIFLLKDFPAKQKQRLQEMHLMYTFLEREIPKLIEHWKKERQTFLLSLKTS